jgi:hypothetical protein
MTQVGARTLRKSVAHAVLSIVTSFALIIGLLCFSTWAQPQRFADAEDAINEPGALPADVSEPSLTNTALDAPPPSPTDASALITPDASWGHGIGFTWTPATSATADPATNTLGIFGTNVDITITTDNDDPNWSYGDDTNGYMQGGNGVCSPYHSIFILEGSTATIRVIADTAGQYGTTTTGGINCSPDTADTPGIDVGGDASAFSDNTTLNLDVAKDATCICTGNGEDGPGIRVEYASPAMAATLNITGSGTVKATGGELQGQSLESNPGIGASNKSMSASGNISIIDATVTALGAECSSGIGTAAGDLHTGNFAGDLSVGGKANVVAMAQGTCGVGIGTGAACGINGGGYSGAFLGNITVFGSAHLTAKALSENHVLIIGIGTGGTSEHSGDFIGNITIKDSATVIAKGEYLGAGIGTGFGGLYGYYPASSGSFIPPAGSHTLDLQDDATLVAQGGSDSCGIGSGTVFLSGGVGTSGDGPVINVTGGKLRADGGNINIQDAGYYPFCAPAIGSGTIWQDNSSGLISGANVGSAGTVIQTGGTIVAQGGGSSANGEAPYDTFAPAIGVGFVAADGGNAFAPSYGSGTDVTVTGGSLYTYGASSVGQSNGNIDTGTFASPSIQGNVKNATGTALYPIYVPKALGASGSITVPALAGVTPTGYVAPLYDLSSAPIFGLAAQSATGTPTLNPNDVSAVPGTDAVSAIIWLPGAAGTYNTYDNIAITGCSLPLTAIAENVNMAYGDEQTPGTAAYTKRNMVIEDTTPNVPVTPPPGGANAGTGTNMGIDGDLGGDNDGESNYDAFENGTTPQTGDDFPLLLSAFALSAALALTGTCILAAALWRKRRT